MNRIGRSRAGAHADPSGFPILLRFILGGDEFGCDGCNAELMSSINWDVFVLCRLRNLIFFCLEWRWSPSSTVPRLPSLYDRCLLVTESLQLLGGDVGAACLQFVLHSRSPLPESLLRST
ncbi:hypothetical protein PIB30_085164 [Stylosanthes scabra]|uniref:Uncharacterized protein n=1 Tax=Stylosanthes scabra TaxID=79078 RepID=A0ABU6QU59_9FABA|nr:hypothetical protein [Stylosanthes scabra]